MKKKYRFEAASDNEAAFLFCEYNPFMKVKVHEFHSLKQMDLFKSDNATLQVRRNLPIILEIIEVQSDDEKLIQINFEQMARWYFYTIVKEQNR